MAADKTDTEIIFPYYRDNELLNVKYLKLERPGGKKLIRQEKDAEPCLFGWQAIPANAQTVVICEGEIDALSWYQYGFPALSVPGGAGNHQWIEYEYSNLNRFSEIYIAFDNDPAGQKKPKEVMQRLGIERCRLVITPWKDCNEALQQGLQHEVIAAALQEAEILDPEELKNASSYVDKVIQRFYPVESEKGVPLPWQKTHANIRLRPNELSIWTGVNGHGKSNLLAHVMLHAMSLGQRVCIASMEVQPEVTLKHLTQQATGLSDPTEEYIRRVHDWYQERLWLFTRVGSAKAKVILDTFAYAKRRYGIDHFVIDSLMKCGIDEDDYRAQKQFIEELCDFRIKYDCHIHLVAHSRKKEDEKTPTGKLDVRGSGTITDLADNVFVTWRNKVKEEHARSGQLDDTKPDTILICEKQKETGWEGKVFLWYEGNSRQFLSSNERKVQRYVH